MHDITRFFVADAHISPSLSTRDEPLHLLGRALADAVTTETIELYILGDMFSFWEEYHPQVAQLYQASISALTEISRLGVSIHIVPGNRDFMIGRRLEALTSAQIMPNGSFIALSSGARAWLEHGDLICTQDTGYLRYRRLIRSWPVRTAYRLTPWPIARRLIRSLQARSAKEKAAKPPSAFAVDLDAARCRLGETGCQILLCGHTHHPQTVELGEGRRLIVLPAWCETQAGWRDRGGRLEPFVLGPQGQITIQAPTPPDHK